MIKAPTGKTHANLIKETKKYEVDFGDGWMGFYKLSELIIDPEPPEAKT